MHAAAAFDRRGEAGCRTNWPADVPDRVIDRRRKVKAAKLKGGDCPGGRHFPFEEI